MDPANVPKTHHSPVDHEALNFVRFLKTPCYIFSWNIYYSWSNLYFDSFNNTIKREPILRCIVSKEP